jgi:FMNH2-dependent dimethyl sulfone monooxygenase
MDTFGAADREVSKHDSPMLSPRHRMKLAIFGLNQRRGTTISEVEGTPKATWEETKAIAQAADEAGIDGLIPLGRWKNMGREDVQEWHRVFETMTWAAGVAAVTERIQVFATVHSPLVHPVHAAKAMATIDHISAGRFGLNLVAGWNEKEFRAFGVEQREHDERYEAAEEWISLIRDLWEADSPIDFDGRFYTAKGAVSEPSPLQKPDVVTMSAGSSPAGRRFAARFADINFVIVPNMEETEGWVQGARDVAREAGRDVAIYSAAHIVCADTEAEAKAAWNYAVNEKRDRRDTRETTENLVGSAGSIDVIAREELETRLAIHSSLPLVGRPEQIVEGLNNLSEQGLDGLAISWVDYAAGVEQLREQIFPLMVEAGLRDA